MLPSQAKELKETHNSRRSTRPCARIGGVSCCAMNEMIRVRAKTNTR
jgi:hypothetical protein